MSNTLTIEVLEFKSAKGASWYGFHAYDSYGQYTENGYNSWEEFYKAYPTEGALVRYVCDRDEFDGIIYDPENHEVTECATNLIVEGYDNEIL